VIVGSRGAAELAELIMPFGADGRERSAPSLKGRGTRTGLGLVEPVSSYGIYATSEFFSPSMMLSGSDDLTNGPC